jgi:hypothetical protein
VPQATATTGLHAEIGTSTENTEPRPSSERTSDIVMPQRTRHALHDREAETHALGAGLVARLEAAEFLVDVFLEMLGGDARPGVEHLDGQEVAAPPAAEQHPPCRV